MFKSFQKKEISNWNALLSNRQYFNYLCTIYKRFQEKTPYHLEKWLEEDLVDFVSDSIFKRLKFDYSSSETVSNQKIKKMRTILLMTACSWRSD